jgi:hypothetical protein
MLGMWEETPKKCSKKVAKVRLLDTFCIFFYILGGSSLWRISSGAQWGVLQDSVGLFFLG